MSHDLLLPPHVARTRAVAERRKEIATATTVRRKVKAMAEQPQMDEAVRHPLALLDPTQRDAEYINPLDEPLPEGLPDPTTWRVAMMPVCQRQKYKGSNLWVAPETLDTVNWTHLLWKVCKVGPLCFRGPAWAGFDEEFLAEQRERLVPGALYLTDAKAHRRYNHKGKLIIVVNDDQLWSWVHPGQVEHLTFKGAGL